MAGNKNSGRKAYSPSDEERVKVRVLKACGMSNEAIAEAMMLSEPTLRKHFLLDLEVGRARVTAEIIMARYEAAKGGSVPAQNRMLEQLGALPPKPVTRRPAKAPKPGKKEAAQAAAETAHESSDWGNLLQ